MIFPSFVAFSAKINGTELFMTCEPKEMLNRLEFNPTAEVPSLLARFVVERVGDNSDLVHIRSCYKNTYLCRTDYTSWYVVAGGYKPIEDTNNVECTLFRVKDLGSQFVTLTHVRTGAAIVYPDTRIFDPYLQTGSDKDTPLCFQVVRFDQLAKLPKRVIFKGNNEHYLLCWLQSPFPIPIPYPWGPPAIEEEKHEYNQFASKDGTNRSAHYEIIHYNGFIRIKSLQYDKYLRLSNNKNYDQWIWGDSSDNTIKNKDTLFRVENLGDNVIALRNLGNNKVCVRISADRLRECLRATETYVVSDARLVVEEPVSWRRIEAQYKMNDARITSRKLILHSTATGINRYKDKDDDLWDSFSYQKTRTTTWNSSTTLTKSVNAEINMQLPKFIDGKLQLSDQTVEVTHLEKGSTFSETRTVRYSIKVPPMTKAILKGYVYNVTYDIPYSYILSDVYTTGEKCTTVVEDGICQGVEAYDHCYEKEYIPL